MNYFSERFKLRTINEYVEYTFEKLQNYDKTNNSRLSLIFMVPFMFILSNIPSIIIFVINLIVLREKNENNPNEFIFWLTIYLFSYFIAKIVTMIQIIVTDDKDVIYSVMYYRYALDSTFITILFFYSFALVIQNQKNIYDNEYLVFIYLWLSFHFLVQFFYVSFEIFQKIFNY